MKEPSAGNILVIISIFISAVLLYMIVDPIPTYFWNDTDKEMSTREIAHKQLIYAGIQGVTIAGLMGLTLGTIFVQIGVKNENIHNRILYIHIKRNLMQIQKNITNHDKTKEFAQIIQSMILATTYKNELESDILELCNNIIIDEDYAKRKNALGNIEALIEELDERIKTRIDFLNNWLGKKGVKKSKK